MSSVQLVLIGSNSLDQVVPAALGGSQLILAKLCPVSIAGCLECLLLLHSEFGCGNVSLALRHKPLQVLGRGPSVVVEPEAREGVEQTQVKVASEIGM